MAHLIAKNRKLCLMPGSRRLVTSNGGAPCVCDGSPQPCDGVNESCYQVTLSGFAPTTCLSEIQLGDGGRQTEILSFAFSASFVRDPSGVSAPPPQIGEIVPVIGTYQVVRAGEVLGQKSVFCWADVRSDVFCQDGEWWATVTASTNIGFATPPHPCVLGAPSLQNYFREEFFASTFKISGPGLNQRVNDGACEYMAEGGVATVALIQDCVGQDQYAVATKCDGSGTISVDLSTRTPGGSAVYYNGDLYVITSELTTDPPVPVEWTTDQCPDVGIESNLWERCGSGGGGFDIPQRVRGGEHPGFGYAIAYLEFPDESDQYPNCRVQYRLRYQKIPDDGGDYPSIALSPRAGPCSAMPPDIVTRFGCQSNGTGPIGEPVDPAGFGGAGFDPMREIFDRQVQNFGCSGCGG